MGLGRAHHDQGENQGNQPEGECGVTHGLYNELNDFDYAMISYAGPDIRLTTWALKNVLGHSPAAHPENSGKGVCAASYCHVERTLLGYFDS